MALWTRDDVVEATGGTAEFDFQANGLSIDTRELEEGDIFIALSASRDGHDFVSAAFEKGAAAALVSYRPKDVADDAPLILVNDVLDALCAMARFARARMSGVVIGVTGSVGKTSTKDMLKCALEVQGKTHAAIRSFNNHWGVPLTLARMPVDTEFGIIEIGMNHPGEIAPLAIMAQLDIAIITTVAEVHLAAFENIEGIAKEKAAIFEGLKPEGASIYNSDIDTVEIIRSFVPKRAKSLEFGENEKADFRLKDISISSGVTTAYATRQSGAFRFKIAAEGRHLATNALAVFAAVEQAGADLTAATMALSNWGATKGRGQRRQVRLGRADGETLEIIDESYNANPTSMAVALELLAISEPVDGVGQHHKGRKIAVLGDMLELGPSETAMHANLSKLSTLGQIDVIHLVGPRMRHLYDALPLSLKGEHFEASQELAAKIHQLIDAGDVIMLKGSLGSNLKLVVDAIEKLNVSEEI